MKVTLLLADSAQVANGKLYILGGGWTVTAGNAPWALAGYVDVPWNMANRPAKLAITMLDSDGNPVQVATPVGQQDFKIEANFELGRPPGMAHGSELRMPLAFNLGPLPLAPGRYELRGQINEAEGSEVSLAFQVVESMPAQQFPG